MVWVQISAELTLISFLNQQVFVFVMTVCRTNGPWSNLTFFQTFRTMFIPWVGYIVL